MTQPARAVHRHDPVRPGPDFLGSLSPDDVVAMLDRLTDGIVVLGPDWRYRYLNEPAAEMLGRTRDSLLGRHIWDEFPEGVGEPFHLAYEQAMRDRTPMRIVDHYLPFGRWFENRIFPQDENLVIVFRDITDSHAVEEELRENVARMAEAETIACFGVWKWDLRDGTVRWSDQLHRIYGVEPGEFEGTAEAFTARLHPDDRERVWSRVSHAIETLEPFAFEERILRADGEERMLLSQGRVLTGPDGAPAALVGVCHDITERARAERALGLSEQRTRAIIDNTPSIVAVKDLDGRYVMTNAETGRVLGVPADQLIGQECVSLFPAELAEQFVANDQRAMSEGLPVYDEAILYIDGEPRTYLTVTFPLPDASGLPAEVCTIGTDVTESRERESERRERLNWRQRISTALEQDRMLVFAQPVIELATGEHRSSELLVRMLEADTAGTVVQPAAFLPAAERFGLVQSIDLWMVRRALALAERLVPEVNLSAVTLCDPAAVDAIVAELKAAPSAARRLVFEITETAAAEHLAAARHFAAEVTALGGGLALDDFGTGFGSFTYLRELPLRYLKIDTSFVRHMAASEDDRRVVQSVIGIARQFGLRTIAEGVEDQTTLDALRAAGADFAQGFHLGRPAPI